MRFGRRSPDRPAETDEHAVAGMPGLRPILAKDRIASVAVAARACPPTFGRKRALVTVPLEDFESPAARRGVAFAVLHHDGHTMARALRRLPAALHRFERIVDDDGRVRERS